MTKIKDKKLRERERTRSTERDYRGYLLCDQSIKIKCRWGDAVFFTPRQTDLKQTEIKGQSLLKCTSCIHIQKKNNSASINYVQRKQTSTNVGMDTIGSKWQSHLLLLHAHSWTAQFILSCLSGVFCQDKWGDFIHISYSRWSLRLFQCQTLVVNPNEQSPWRTEWGQPPSTRSLSASVARCGSLCACLPHLRSHRLLNLTWENKNLSEGNQRCVILWTHTSYCAVHYIFYRMYTSFSDGLAQLGRKAIWILFQVLKQL